MKITKIVILLLVLILMTGIFGCSIYLGTDQATIPVVLTETSTPLTPQNIPLIEGKLIEDEKIDSSNVESIIENNVIKADFIILGTITDFRYEKANDLSGNAVYTIFTLTAEKTIKGDPNTKEVFIKLPGGIIRGTVGTDGKSKDFEELPSRGYFHITDKVLVCLQKGEVDYYCVMIPLGTLWAKTFDGNEFVLSKPNGERMTLKWMMGFTIKTMRENNIPIGLPPNEIYPEPAG
jgi:hypothetical protein